MTIPMEGYLLQGGMEQINSSKYRYENNTFIYSSVPQYGSFPFTTGRNPVII